MNDKNIIYELVCKESSQEFNYNNIDTNNIKKIVFQEQNKKKEIIAKFNNSKTIQVAGYIIAGYNPMNMFRLNDYIYCSHFIFLNKEDDNKFIQQEVTLTMKKNSSNELVSYKIL